MKHYVEHLPDHVMISEVLMSIFSVRSSDPFGVNYTIRNEENIQMYRYIIPKYIYLHQGRGF